MKMTQLLIIGAGPYGLSTAAYARHVGVDYLLLGEPMGFWKGHMPECMLLRSPTGWHLDPLGDYTFSHYLEDVGLRQDDVNPIPVSLFLDYAHRFQERHRLLAEPTYVRELRLNDGLYEATLEGGESVSAHSVVVAPGLRHFAHIPIELVAELPLDRYSHSCDINSFDALKGKRCLIVGGRQSAFEWAALMVEAGAAEVHISYRHDTPRFAPSDWSWVDAIVDHIGRSPGWFGRLSQDEREGVQQRFWAEGRLKLEPWLEPRLRRENITLWPSTAVVQAVELCSGEVCVKLDTGAQLRVDHLVLATGYKVDLSRLPYLSRDSVLPALNVADGYPVLNEGFESSLPGLFFTGPSAVRDLGPFFGFVLGCPAAARVIVDRVNIRHSRGVASG